VTIGLADAQKEQGNLGASTARRAGEAHAG